MLVKSEFAPIVIEVRRTGNLTTWRVQYLERRILSGPFLIKELDGDIETYLSTIIRVNDQTVLILLGLPIEYTFPNHERTLQFEKTFTENQILDSLSKADLEKIREAFVDSYKCFENSLNGVIFTNIKDLKNDDNISFQKECEEIEKTNDAMHQTVKETSLLELNYQMGQQEKIERYQAVVTEYYRLMTEADLANSDSDVYRIQEILQLAEEDETLSLLLNEVDNLIVQESPSNSDVHNPDSYDQYADCEERRKWAEVFKIHIDCCNQLDSSVSRLMTRISSLIEKLQDFRSSETFSTALESPQSIDAKVQSLKLLKKEAEVENQRRKIRDCLEITDGQSLKPTAQYYPNLSSGIFVITLQVGLCLLSINRFPTF